METLLILGIILLVVALVAYLLGAHGVAGMSIEIAKWVFIVAIVLIVVFAVVALLGGGSFRVNVD